MSSGSVRLHFGEFYNPRGDDASVSHHARLYFLEAIEQEAPEAIDALRDRVLPSYEKAYGYLVSNLPPQPVPPWAAFPDTPATKYPQREDLAIVFLYWPCLLAARRVWPIVNTVHDALESWANIFHIQEDWLLNEAMRTLYWRMMLPESFSWEGWVRPKFIKDAPTGRELPGLVGLIRREEAAKAFEADEPLFTFTYPAWNPTSSTRAEYERSINVKIQAELKRQLDAVEALAEGQGLRRAPEKRTPEDHYKWLVLYQVKGWSYGQISKVCSVDRNTVKAAIERAAGLIGIRIRPSAGPGRPKKRTP